MRQIVVMGGSFNPPTQAHLKVIQAAMDAVSADKGYFVPVSFAYLKRKMRKIGSGNFCMSDEVRWKMLEAMCLEDKRLAVSDLEIHEVQAVTYHMMSTFAKKNPGASCYLVIGADKLELMARIGRKTNFLERFGLIVFSRDDIDTEKRIMDIKELREHRNAIILLKQPEGIEAISSTEVRRRILKGDSTAEYVCAPVLDMLKHLNVEDFPEEIDRFKDEYEYLNNSYPVSITWEGMTYLSAENAFQASKSREKKVRRLFTDYPVDSAKQKGGALTAYEGWEKEKVMIMEEILRRKFEQHPDLAEKLAATENAVLIAGNNGKDQFWGIDLYSWQGENQLGKLLMKVREEYQK